MVHLTINSKEICVEPGITIFEAAKQNSITIPSLCNFEGVHSFGSCRICVVEVEGAKTLQASCVTPVAEGMVVHTNSKAVRDARKVIYELLLSDHDTDCLFCNRNQHCELQRLGRQLGIDESRFEGERSERRIDASVSITRDLSKCVLCRRCVTVCNEIQQVGILNAQNRGFKTVIGPSFDLPIGSDSCSFCGQCTVVCPVGALKETDSTQAVWEALNDETKRVVVQVAPAVRVAIGESFGYPAGTRCTGKLASALKELGFDDVFDTNWAADLTILEEGTEFLDRAHKALTGKGAVLPMVTSCSPGWIKYIENHFPKSLDHLSTCKSPHTMLGAVVKSYYADKIGVDPKDIVVVSVMPCTAKKFEIRRPEMQNGGYANVDEVITTRELAEMIKGAGINFDTLTESSFHKPLGLSSGAAAIFGVTGGVMEAALRTVYELVTGRELPFESLHVTPIVGLEQIKEAFIKFENVLPEFNYLEGFEVGIAVTNGLAGAKILMKQVEDGTSPYHFIEVMGCPGGCITGGGQPRSKDPDIKEKRMKATYEEDENLPIRKSHENPSIIEFYEEFLGKPNGHLSHELLHTSYTKRGLYNEMTEENYVIDAEQHKIPKTFDHLSKTRSAGDGGEEYSLQILELKAKNARLKEELDDTLETVEIFRNIIVNMNKDNQ